MSLAIAEAGAGDLGAVAGLHRELLGDSQLTRLGAPFVAGHYYPTLLRNGLGQVLLARVDGELAGFAAFTTDTRRFLGLVAANKPALALRLVQGFLGHPVEVARAALRAFGTVGSVDDEPGSDIPAEFLSFGVRERFRDPAYVRASGISVAKSLFREVRERYRAMGVPRFKLFPPAEDEGKLGPSLLYRMMGAKQAWRGRARDCELSLYICDTGAAK